MTGSASVGESAEVFRRLDDVELRMHLYLPRGGDAVPRSGIIFYFGGGWVNGTAGHFQPQARHLASLGMVAACAEYRIASRHGTSPLDALDDALAAMAWMRQNAVRFGVAPDRIVAAGGSAGGHLAACCALTSGTESGAIASSTCPDALVLFNPVLDTTSTGFGEERIPAGRAREISPCHLVKANLPPSLVLHGTADSVVPFENAERFATLMSAAGNRCKLIAYPGREHGFFNRKEGAEEDYLDTLRQTERFLRTTGFLPA